MQPTKIYGKGPCIFVTKIIVAIARVRMPLDKISLAACQLVRDIAV